MLAENSTPVSYLPDDMISIFEEYIDIRFYMYIYMYLLKNHKVHKIFLWFDCQIIRNNIDNVHRILSHIKGIKCVLISFQLYKSPRKV